YVIDVQTGERTLLLQNHYMSASRTLDIAPNGKFLAYYKQGHYYLVDLTSKSEVCLTKNVPSYFINTEDDHNVKDPATPFVGWSVDSKFALIRDMYNLWKISVDGTKFTNLSTVLPGSKIQVTGIARIYPDDKGVDF